MFCSLTIFLILISKLLGLSTDSSIFFIYVNNTSLGYAQLIFSAVFDDTLLFEIYDDICHLKYMFHMYSFCFELVVYCCY